MRRTLILALAALVAIPAAGQSLGEVAAKEKERRQKAAAAGTKTYTEEDLKGAHGTSGPSPTPSPSPSPASGGRGTPGMAAARAAGARTDAAESPSQDAVHEQQWRTEATNIRNAIEDAQRGVEAAQTKLDSVRTGLSQPQPIDAMRQQPLNPLVKDGGQVAAEQALADAKAALEKARQDQVAFEERARKASVPPGWLR